MLTIVKKYCNIFKQLFQNGCLNNSYLGLWAISSGGRALDF